MSRNTITSSFHIKQFIFPGLSNRFCSIRRFNCNPSRIYRAIYLLGCFPYRIYCSYCFSNSGYKRSKIY